jgi:predicted AAA+ superfamily ATPase
MQRALISRIRADLHKKIILITGPRQTGKTTLAKMLTPKFDYFNFDDPEHRSEIQARSWDRSKELIIFDELHKLKGWKSWLKGVFDTEKIPPALVVTGSAKLDTYRKVGDSLAGRFFQYRLHPFDLKELKTISKTLPLEKNFETLMNVGGFPEPFLETNMTFYNRWKQSHLDIIIKQDLVDMESVRNLISISTLIQLLRKRVGSPISYSSLARDLQVNDKTIKSWLTILENMYVVFKIVPYHRNLARSLLKAPKYYFYDNGQVLGDNGIKLENLVACALLKELQFRQDCLGETWELCYLRNKEMEEVDFLLVRDEKPKLMIEAKWGEEDLSRNFLKFQKHFPNLPGIQLVRNLRREKTFASHFEVRQAIDWLATIPINKKTSD